MSIQFACDACGKDFTVGDALGGKKGKCNGCGHLMTIPLSTPVSVYRPSAAPVAVVSPTSAPANVQVVVNQDSGKSANGLGVAAVVIGVLAILVCWIPFLNLLVVPFVFIGGLLAIIGLLVALTSKKSGPGWPITGIGLNAFAFVVMLLVNFVIGGTIAAAAKQAAEQARVQEAARDRAEAQRAARLPEPIAVVPVVVEPVPDHPKAPAGSEHQPGDRLVVMDRDGLAVVSCLDEQTFRKLLDAPDRDRKAAMAKVWDKLVGFQAYSKDWPVIQGVEFLEDAPPDLAKVRIITGPDRGKTVFLGSRFLLTPLEAAREIGVIEEKEKQAQRPAAAKALEQVDQLNAERDREAKLREVDDDRREYVEAQARMKARKDAADSAAAAKAKAARPASLLAMGKNFERDVNTKAALETYRKLVADFAGTPQAIEAAGRIKALTGK